MNSFRSIRQQEADHLSHVLRLGSGSHPEISLQDFLFRRSIDGNPDILRAGSENLDAARRAALIAKLEAQAGTLAPAER